MQLLILTFVFFALLAEIIAVIYLVRAVQTRTWQPLLFAVIFNSLAIVMNQLYLRLHPLQPPLPGTIFSLPLGFLITVFSLLIFIPIFVVFFLIVRRYTQNLVSQLVAGSIALWLTFRLLIVLLNSILTWWFVHYDIFDPSVVYLAPAHEMGTLCPKNFVFVKVTKQGEVAHICFTGGILPKIEVLKKPPLISYKIYSREKIEKFNKINDEWAVPKR